MKKYILLYGDKKKEDNICIKNMFTHTEKITLSWTEFDNINNKKIIDKYIREEKVEEIIFLGLEIGWDKLIQTIKKEYPKIQIKVICNTQDSLLYYEYERENFFKLLELSKKKIIDNIAFLKKSQYELYKKLGYICSHIKENYILSENNKKQIKNTDSIINIGIYPLSYTWDKNIFNQLCIAKFIDNANINYNKLDERMKDFLETMDIKSAEDNIKDIDEENIIEKIVKNNINISCSFTEYFHTIFFISMEQGIPCLIGNTSDLFEGNKELENYIVTDAEDNPIINSEKVKKCLNKKEKIMQLYKDWKKEYNKLSKQSIEEFIEK